MSTRNDIARYAGVSTATVSRVLNNMEAVSPKLRERVLKAVEELNYRPNLTAKGLKTQRSYNIAYLIPDITNPYYTEIYKGINQTVAPSGYTCSLIEAAVVQSYENLFKQRFDGVICAIDMDEKLKAAIIDLNIPTVMQSEECINWGLQKCVCVTHNLKDAMFQAFDYILSKGHKNIGLITQKKQGCSRLSLYMDAINKYGLEYTPETVVEYTGQPYHYLAGYSAMKELINKSKGISAVIAQNDLVAIGAISAASKHGYVCPDNISFLGCDDTVAAHYCVPPLTTIKLFKEKQGVKSAQLLLEMIEGKTVENYEFKAELVVRDSIV